MKTITRTLISFFSLLAVSFFGYAFVVEPATVAAQSDTDQFYVNLQVDSAISITDCPDVTMSPNLGINQNKSTGQSVCTVTTNNVDGYTLQISELDGDADPAMEHQGAGEDIADFSAVAVYDLWSVDLGAVEFGYSVVGDDASFQFGQVASCEDSNTLGTTSQRWRSLIDSNIFVVFATGEPTSFDGTDTIFCFAVEQNGVYADSGTYQAGVLITTTAI